jgi:hypothetical protein
MDATQKARRDQLIRSIRRNFKVRNNRNWSGPGATNPNRLVIRSAIKIVRLFDRHDV